MRGPRSTKRVCGVLRRWVLLGCLAAAAAPAAAQGTPPRPAPFELLASVAYGDATTAFRELRIEPYGPLFGAEFGYTWGFGLRLGAHVNYGLGRSVTQRYERGIGREITFTNEAQSLSSSASLGYDLPLYFLILRYSINWGITWMRRDFGALPYESLGGYSPTRGTAAGFQLAPRVALLWPVGRFECGLGLHYVVQFSDGIPSGLLGELLLGTRL